MMRNGCLLSERRMLEAVEPALADGTLFHNGSSTA